MEFCKQYNAATESQRGTVIPVDITIYEDRSFTFVLKTPPTPVLLRQAAGMTKGPRPRAGSRWAPSPTPSWSTSPRSSCLDLNTDDLEAAKKQVAGTARSMGIAVVG